MKFTATRREADLIAQIVARFRERDPTLCKPHCFSPRYSQ